MKCPTCNKPIDKLPPEWRPFCSERCKLVDLSKWLDGEYRIPGEPSRIPNDDRWE
ncbi:MAG: DNA gyrase inhibitor YacG [Deltaproteobacteria bacterium]|nr:MAG: DNA gyrase inhibitor YacG [Deltaproteobacteria bacterium]